MKLFEFEQRIASGGPSLEFEKRAHASEHRRVQAIGLGELASGLGEATRLTGIDLGERDAGRPERAFAGAMIGAGRLEDDAFHRLFRQSFEKRLAPTRVVDETAACPVGQPVGVEMVFRHIDADGIVLHLFRASACHSGLSPG